MLKDFNKCGNRAEINFLRCWVKADLEGKSLTKRYWPVPASYSGESFRRSDTICINLSTV